MNLLRALGAPVAKLLSPRRPPQHQQVHRKYFFGVTRFSLYQPSSTSWRLTRHARDEYVDRLYSDERMQPRMDIFLRCALPIYASMAQRHRYWHIVKFSSVMPERYKAALRDAAAASSVLVLEEWDETGSRVEGREAMHCSLDEQGSGSVAQFRIDDDDLLASDYLDQLAQYVQEPFRGMAVSFGFGLGAIYSDGRFSSFRDLPQRFPSMGQAFIGSWDADARRLDLPGFTHHVRPDRQRPTIVDSRRPTYLRTFHALQDVRVTDPTSRLDKELADQKAPTDMKRLVQAFPTLKADLRRDLKPPAGSSPSR